MEGKVESIDEVSHSVLSPGARQFYAKMKVLLRFVVCQNLYISFHIIFELENGCNILKR